MRKEALIGNCVVVAIGVQERGHVAGPQAFSRGKKSLSEREVAPLLPPAGFPTDQTQWKPEGRRPG